MKVEHITHSYPILMNGNIFRNSSEEVTAMISNGTAVHRNTFNIYNVLHGAFTMLHSPLHMYSELPTDACYAVARCNYEVKQR